TVTVAGRTDSGVHAIGQVAAFRTNSTIPIQKFRRGLQTFLPEDIAVVDAIEVHDEFHATYWAIKKRYRYIMYDGPVLMPFLRRYVVDLSGRRLDLSAMQHAAAHLLGTHDFRCFESHFPNKATSVRTILDAVVERTSRWPGWMPVPLEHSRVQLSDGGPIASVGFDNDFVILEVEADGFLYNMVRTIAGSLMKIGLGQWEPDRMQSIIEGMDRSQAGHTAPACGLYLVSVDYRDHP
ncbi:MAG: tRNA pseudouridine(38-40) synthase TruA, partial [Planctomycetaceae bacterium]